MNEFTGAQHAAPLDEKRRLAEAVRAACVRAALESYERAGLGGLCDEGRWEAAIDAIRSLDIDAILQTPSREPPA